MTDIWGTTDHSQVQAKIVWWPSQTNVAGNYTVIHAALWARRTNTGYTTYGTFNGGITINGNRLALSKPVTLGPSQDWVLLGEHEHGVAGDGWGNATATVSADGGIPGTGWNTTTLSMSQALPRLVLPPEPVSSLVVTRVTDQKHTITVTHPPVHNRAPASYTVIQQYNYFNPSLGWHEKTRGNYPQTVFTDNDTVADGHYQWRARREGPGGVSRWVATSNYYTTPAPPSSVTAIKQADNSIKVSWVSGSRLALTNFYIYDNGTRVATVAGNVTTWTHSSPDATREHVYSVAAGMTTMTSAQTKAAAVKILTQPNAPTLSTPAAGQVTLAGVVSFVWRHNPVDTTAQTGYELEYQIGTATPVVVKGTTTQSTTISIPTAATVKWRVRTKGRHASFSPWSGYASFNTATAPVLTITRPGATVDTNTVSVLFAWVQAQGYKFTTGTARLLTASGTVLEAKTVPANTATVVFTTRLENNTSYKVELRLSNQGLTASKTVSFTVVFTRPAHPIVSGVWLEDTGGHSLTVQDSNEVSMLPAVSDYQTLTTAGINPYNTNFGFDSVTKEIWIAGLKVSSPYRGGHVTQRIKLYKDRLYRLSYTARSTIDGTIHYIQLRRSQPGVFSLSWLGEPLTRVGNNTGGSSGYVVYAQKINKATAAYSYDFRPDNDCEVALFFYGNHVTGADNSSGYQWFGDLKLAEVSGAATTSMLLERSTDEGLTWDTVTDTTSRTTNMTDFEGLSNGVTLYRATATAATGASASTQISVVSDSLAGWIGTGATFSNIIKIPYDLDDEVTAGRERTFVTYAGRRLPVAYSSPHVVKTVTVRGTILNPLDDNTAAIYDDTGTDIKRVIDVAETNRAVFLYRNPDSLNVYGMIENMTINRADHAHRGISFTITETEKQ